MENPSSNINIGKRVAYLRKLNHLSQAQLAEKIGTTNKHVSEIERGVTGISIDTQVLLGKALNCSIDYLIKGDEFKSIDYLLPKYVLEIFNSGNKNEIELLSSYLELYEKIHYKI